MKISKIKQFKKAIFKVFPFSLLNTQKNFECLVLILPVLIMILSGFAQSKEVKEAALTRIELAQAINKLIEKSNLDTQIKNSCFFSDIDNSTYETIRLTLNHRIMNGYSDGTFRPNEPLRNLETIFFLKKAASIISEHNIDDPIVNFFRAIVWQDYATDGLKIFSFKMMPASLAEPSGFTPVEIVERLERFISQNDTPLFNKLTGVILDSITKKPIRNAYITVNGNVSITDNKGYFIVNSGESNSSEAELFAVADGYRPLSIKRECGFNTDFQLRLNPIVPPRIF